MIRCVSHACYVVSDLERSIAFYRDRLGLRTAFDFRSEEGKMVGAYLHAGERTFIELFTGTPGPAPADASFRHICLEVEDIEGAVKSLRQDGIEVSDPALGSDGSFQAWLKDPDGNSIELHHFLPDSRQINALKALGA